MYCYLIYDQKEVTLVKKINTRSLPKIVLPIVLLMCTQTKCTNERELILDKYFDILMQY
jgi:hypothetical protein